MAMNSPIPQTLVVGLVVVAATVLKALGQISDELIAATLTGALTWAGGHALGYAAGRNSNDNADADTPKPPVAK